MVIFQWDRSLETGIELIDRQHRQIVQRANAFFINYKCGGDQTLHDKCAECLGFLQQYILYHFQCEEAYQVECSYPGYRSHQALHKSLATQVKFLSVQLAESAYAHQEIERFYLFLSDWVRQHLLEEDRAFAAYYHKFKEELDV